MKAHFIGSLSNISTDVKYYRQIISTLSENNITLTRDWLEKAYEQSTKSSDELSKPSSWRAIYRDNLQAISRCDVVVAEVSQKSFLVGFQVALALQKKKPVLILSRHEKVDSISGVSSNEDIIKHAVYDEKNLHEIIRSFISENNKGGKDIRFNFFMDRKLLNYLNWASFQTGHKKSEIIRELLVKEMERSEFDR